MRKLVLATCMIILQSFPALAAEDTTVPQGQPIQVSEAQWGAYPVQQQPVMQPQLQRQQPVAAVAAPTTAAPDITNSWDVMQFNFGM